MRGLRARIRQLHRASVWAQGAIGPDDVRVESLLRGYLPQLYMAAALGGLLGALGGIPALRQTFGEDYATAFGLLLAGACLLAGAGHAFPARLWRVELISVSVIWSLLMFYAITVVVAGAISGDVGRAAVGAFIYSMALLPRWRMVDVKADAERNGWS